MLYGKASQMPLILSRNPTGFHLTWILFLLPQGIVILIFPASLPTAFRTEGCSLWPISALYPVNKVLSQWSPLLCKELSRLPLITELGGMVEFINLKIEFVNYASWAKLLCFNYFFPPEKKTKKNGAQNPSD